MINGDTIIQAIKRNRDRKQKRRQGDVGRFWRDGGNNLIYENLPIDQESLVIDAGGYEGEWTSEMMVRYGCRSLIFEPMPDFARYCKKKFLGNQRVQVFESALGGSNRTTNLFESDNGTSEYAKERHQVHQVSVKDIVDVIDEIDDDIVSCLKLNIEGGEYEVLERLLAIKMADRFRSLLIQFHRQPPGYEGRYAKIVDGLSHTHERVWGYEMVWEKWVIK
jgi:FkbM family methyltransferase